MENDEKKNLDAQLSGSGFVTFSGNPTFTLRASMQIRKTAPPSQFKVTESPFPTSSSCLLVVIVRRLGSLRVLSALSRPQSPNDFGNGRPLPS